MAPELLHRGAVEMTERGEKASMPSEATTPNGSRHQHLESSRADLLGRIRMLASLLPAFAQETAAARREATRLRSQNARLQRRVDELETRFEIPRDPRSGDG
jgi:chromosome segregation ATPase